MQLLIDKKRLDKLMKGKGIRNYRELAFRAKERGLTLSEGTIYKMIEEPTWSATRLHALCEMLDCKPSDLIPDWQEEANGSDTHASPRPEEELEKVYS